MKNNSERMGTEAILPLLFKLAIPSMIGMLSGSLYNIIDSIYLGHLSTEALSALSLAFPIQLFMISVSGGLGIASSSLISRLLGKNEPGLIKETTETVTLLVVIYSIITAIIGGFFAHDIISLFTGNATLIKMGGDYLRIVMIGSIMMVVPMVFNNFLRGYGDTVTPMYTMLIGTILNIIIDPILIFGMFFIPKLGVSGAAYATVCSRIVSVIFVLTVLLKKGYYINLKIFKPQRRILKELGNVGIPAMAMMVMGSIMLLGANKIIAEFSIIGIAVLGIFGRLQSFIMMPVMGISQGFQPLLGYNYGRNNKARVKKTIWSGLGIVFAFSIVGFVSFWFFPGILIKMFSNDPELIRIGTIALKRISIGFPFMGLSMLISTAFQAIGKGFPSLFLSILRQLVLLLPLMYILGQLYGLGGAWFAFGIAEGFSFIIASLWITHTIKKDLSKME
ncbi:MAG: MATE family efflux transporter [Nanobdellota archaeon]